MKQTCKICGSGYHVNMGVFGIPETKVIICPSCKEEIYEFSGEKIVAEEPVLLQTSSINIEPDHKESSAARHQLREGVIEIQSRKQPVFLGRIIHAFSWIWAATALLSFLFPLAVLHALHKEERQEPLLLLLASLLIPMFCASMALLFFIIKYTFFRRNGN